MRVDVGRLSQRHSPLHRLAVVQMEGVSQRQLERQAKVAAEAGALRQRLEVTQDEVKKVRLRHSR
jgi:hypothetical protein